MNVFYDRLESGSAAALTARLVKIKTDIAKIRALIPTHLGELVEQ